MIRRRRIINVCIVTFLILAQSLPAAVKNIGTPSVTNYDNLIINAGTQTWMIDIGANGLAYFANNDGVLEFDGLTWRTYQLPKESVVRSVKATHDGRIYAGGYNEFGYFQANQHGQLAFHSLHHLIPEELGDYGEVWRIFETDNSIVFQTFTQVMVLSNDTILVIPAPDMFHFSFLVNNELLINDQSEGLFRLKGDKLQKLPGTEKLNGKLIWGILPKGDNILIATADEGIFIYDGLKLTEWSNSSSSLLKEKQVFTALSIDDFTYAFGTIQDGLIICDTAGNLIQHLNVEKGLLNNTVLSMQVDQFSNLWLGLDNGIDYVEINSPLTYFSTYNNIGSGYAAVVHNGLLYLGTNRGVFYHDWESLTRGGGDQKFRLVPGTQGQVWSLKVIEGTLFCGHNSGVFIIEGNNAEMLSGVQGGWTFIQPGGRNDIVICGTYTCLIRFERKNGKWSKGVQVKGFKESSRYLANAGPQSIWISHGYKGVFRVHFDHIYDSVVSIDFYNSQHGFPSDKDITVQEVKGMPVFTTGKGLYRYDERSDTFIPEERIQSRLSRNDMNILREDSQGNLWYFTEDEAGVYRLQEDGTYAPVDIPFRELKGKFIKWFQFVYPHDDKNVFISTQNGFVHYSPGSFNTYQQPFSAYIRSMQILSGIDSVIYKGSSFTNDFYTSLPFKFNDLQFEFAANDFVNPESVSFLIKLEGFDENWVEWHTRSARQFTNLQHGDYTLRLKAINIFGVESREARLKFVIRPPWYFSLYAYIAYAIIFVLAIILVVKYIRYRIEAAKRVFEEEQKKRYAEREKQLQIESLTAEKELIRLRNEKLRTEKTQKDKELANTTMQIIQKSKTLVALKNDILKLGRELGKHPASDHLHTIIKKINRSIDTDKQWEVFESHFENVHEEFLTRLKENYTDLSPRELKLCAYLRLNISSKEIANLMNISVRGVEISRYRLRKKLALAHDTNLTEFIMTF